MVEWRAPWRAFRKKEDDESYLLGELSWELAPHPDHELSNKVLEIAGWIPGYDHLVLYLPEEDAYIYVRLTWNKDGKRLAPHAQRLGDEVVVAKFVADWNTADPAP